MKTRLKLKKWVKVTLIALVFVTLYTIDAKTTEEAINTCAEENGYSYCVQNLGY